VSWVALVALLFSKAVFHIVGTIQSRRCSPGVFMGVLAYIPLALFGGWRFIHADGMPVMTAVAAVVLGGSYHLWAGIGHKLRASGRWGGAASA
jgi:hypothetical protein